MNSDHKEKLVADRELSPFIFYGFSFHQVVVFLICWIMEIWSSARITFNLNCTAFFCYHMAWHLHPFILFESIDIHIFVLFNISSYIQTSCFQARVIWKVDKIYLNWFLLSITSLISVKKLYSYFSILHNDDLWL